jgi:phosphatidylserine synthase
VVVVVVVNQALRPTHQVVLPAAPQVFFTGLPYLKRVVQAHLVVLGQVEQDPSMISEGELFTMAMVVLAVLVAHEVRLAQVEEMLWRTASILAKPVHTVAAVAAVPYRAMQI